MVTITPDGYYSQPLNDFFNNQFTDGEFRRMEVIVRYLFIEHYFGENDFGRDFYLKVGWDEHYAERFETLIESFKVNGFDKIYPIPTINGFMSNGAHRFACALYFNVPTVYITPSNEYELYDKVSRFGREWIENWDGSSSGNKLTKDEVNLLYNKLTQIGDKINA